MEHTLTTKAIKAYKVATLVLMLLGGGVYLIMGANIAGVWGVIVYGVFVIFIIRKFFNETHSKIKEVSYDKESLYVREEGYDVQIPFHQVKDIEIVSMDGLYKFKLYHHDQFGNEVICKPSIWYPFNYKRIDAELNRIRSYVRKAHREYKEQIGSDRSLPSN
ncbi:hypothetical protein [Ekhidna sp.]|uniref:hypothetical protein n=1 Tax=Ekhidna sp. TaxID=2608089 RepID=UPI003C79AF20